MAVDTRTTESRPASARYVTIPRAAEETGYSEKAMRRKIEDGVWLEGHEWIRAPDGRILIDVEGYYRWARGERVAA
jgi:hypothetical protein